MPESLLPAEAAHDPNVLLATMLGLALLALAWQWKSHRADMREERTEAREERNEWRASIKEMTDANIASQSSTNDTLGGYNVLLAALKEKLS